MLILEFDELRHNDTALAKSKIGAVVTFKVT